jgi:hypothetical protein
MVRKKPSPQRPSTKTYSHQGDLIKLKNLDLVAIQETKKESISQAFLDGVSVLVGNMCLQLVLQVGLRDSTFELISWQGFKFCSMFLVKSRLGNFVWRIINVYGSPYEEGKMEFVDELHSVMDKWNGPTMVGGTST